MVSHVFNAFDVEPLKHFLQTKGEITYTVPHLTGEMQSAEYGRWRTVPSGHMHPSDMPEHCTALYSNSLLGHEGAVQAGRHAWYCNVPGHRNATKSTNKKIHRIYKYEKYNCINQFSA